MASTRAIRAWFARRSDDPTITLITFDHDDLDQPVRVAINTVGDDIVSNGLTFTAVGSIQASFVTDDDQPPRGQIGVVNVDGEIGLALQDLEDPVKVTMQAVQASDPDTVEKEIVEFEWRDVEVTSLLVTGSVSHFQLTDEPFPFLRVVPRYFHALFR